MTEAGNGSFTLSSVRVFIRQLPTLLPAVSFMLRLKRGAKRGRTTTQDSFDVPEQKRLFVPDDNLPGGWNIRGEISFVLPRRQDTQFGVWSKCNRFVCVSEMRANSRLTQNGAGVTGVETSGTRERASEAEGAISTVNLFMQRMNPKVAGRR